MPFKPPTLSILLAIAAALTAAAMGPAAAAGLGPGLSTPLLGQPLDFALQVRLDAGEPLTPECVSAEVLIGERRLPAGLVRVTLEASTTDSARIRVGSTQTVDEPVVTVTVVAGCASRVSRRYVLLVDPPALGPAVAAPAFAAAPVLVPASMQAAPAADSGAAGSAAAGAGTPSASATALAAASAPAGARANAIANASASANANANAGGATATGATRSSTPNPARATNRAARKVAQGGERMAPRAEVRRPRRTAQIAQAAAPARAAEAAPRLKLEAAEPIRSAEAIAVEQALEVVAQAASAARAMAAAASASSDRIATLERSVEQLRGESRAQRDAAAQLRERLARTDGASRWIWPLAGLVLLLAALTMWLAWRLSAVQRRRDGDWRQALVPAGAPPVEGTSSKPATAPIPFVTSEIAPAKVPTLRTAPAWPPPAPIEFDGMEATVTELRPSSAGLDPASQRTQPLAPFTLAAGDAVRDLSIEELIDLEQQAEFFAVLGQDEAAIDLLVEHLRHTGGTSPLPYLKLLEIYGRRGDREAYERMRARFNRRFNAYAPEWGADLAQGRTLEDYAGVVPRLEQVWSRPLDAMTELEALLFRKSHGELFDLPAYREVLFLYSLARDLLDRQSLDSGNVDLLLPMADSVHAADRPASHPYLGLESDSMPLEGGDERITGPVDLDLSRGDKPTSIFDPLDDSRARPRRS